MCPLWGRRYYKWILRTNFMFHEMQLGNPQGLIDLLENAVSLRALAADLGMLAGDTAGFEDYLDTLEPIRDEIIGPVLAAVQAGDEVFFDWAFAPTPLIEVNGVSATQEQSAAVVVVVRAPFEPAA
jgi:hypothetical protein